MQSIKPSIKPLDDILFTQGFGTRRICAGLVQQGWVQVRHGVDAPWSLVTNAQQPLATEQLQLQVTLQGRASIWPYADKAYLVMHKPAGFECSHKPGAHPSVYTLLPAPLRQRPQKSAIQGVQAIGRLDVDTTGLLLLSDDGAFIHRMTHPKKHVPKIYAVTCKHPITPAMLAKLTQGVVLDDDPQPVAALAAVATGDLTLDLTLQEGKYHQVKRMLAAVGNRVEGLHRSQIGQFVLPPDLAAGQWRWLTADDLALLTQASPPPQPA